MNNQRKMIALGIAVVALVGVLVYNFVLKENPADNYEMPDITQTSPNAGGQAGGSAPASAAPSGTAAAPGVQASLQADEVDIDELILSVKEVSFDYDSVRQARDPMTPLVGRQFRADEEGPDQVSGNRLMQMARSMILTGIIWDQEEPLAILNDEVVSQGYVFSPDDLTEGIVVDTIEPGRVILRVDETLIPLNLEEQ